VLNDTRACRLACNVGGCANLLAQDSLQRRTYSHMLQRAAKVLSENPVPPGELGAQDEASIAKAWLEIPGTVRELGWKLYRVAIRLASDLRPESRDPGGNMRELKGPQFLHVSPPRKRQGLSLSRRPIPFRLTCIYQAGAQPAQATGVSKTQVNSNVFGQWAIGTWPPKTKRLVGNYITPGDEEGSDLIAIQREVSGTSAILT